MRWSFFMLKCAMLSRRITLESLLCWESIVGGHRRGGLAGLWCWSLPFGRLRNFIGREGFVESCWWLDMGDETGIIGAWRV